MVPTTIWLKKRIVHLPKLQNNNLPVISKCHLTINFLAQKGPYFHLQKVQNKNFPAISKHGIPCHRKYYLIVFLRTKK